MISRRFLCSTVLLAIVQNISANGGNLVVDLGYASYQGYQLNDTSVYVWNAMPYAAPPTGDLRWRPPVPIEEHFERVGSPDGIINATQSGPLCVQGNPAWSLPDPNTPVPNIGVEDCLIVDVMTPTNIRHGKLLPVVVHIHGGGFTLGNSNWEWGKPIERHSGGAIIFASIQYRLGAFGFLASQDVMKDGTANAGLLDQRLAIEWVQKYISRFGGDPNQIVIEGGSAGGGSVTAQMMLYGAKDPPLFQAAIPEWPWWQPFHGSAILEAQYKDLLNFTNCTTLKCLRNVSFDELSLASRMSYISGYKAEPKPLYAYGDFYYGPTVDGEIIRDFPSRMFERGEFHNVPVLTSHAEYEGRVFSNTSMTTHDELVKDLQSLFPAADSAFFDELFALYPEKDYSSVYDQRQTLFGDFIINCPTRWIMEAVTEKDQNGWKLIFNAGSLTHGADGAYVFDYPTPGTNDTLAEYMKDWFISFMVSHDPNRLSWIEPSVQKPIWPVYESSHNTLVVYPQSIYQAPDKDFGSKCDFWESHPEEVRNKRRRDLLSRPVFV